MKFLISCALAILCMFSLVEDSKAFNNVMQEQLQYVTCDEVGKMANNIMKKTKKEVSIRNIMKEYNNKRYKDLAFEITTNASSIVNKHTSIIDFENQYYLLCRQYKQ